MIDAFIRKLDAMRAEIADLALKRPREGTAFEYGRVVGLCEGVDRARAAILNVHEDQKNREFN